MLEGMTDTVHSLGYLGIFLLVLVAPTPPEIVLPFAGFLAAQGKLSLVYVVLAGVSGCTLSVVPWYLAGKYLGESRLREFAKRHRRWLKLSFGEIERAKYWFDRHGGKTVFFSRSIPSVRTLIALPAGMSGMRLLPFLLYVISGETLWQSALAYAGYLLGSRYELVVWYTTPVARILVVVLLLVFVVWIVRRKRSAT
jgi:membrane protein DedA with SNARE-associated domain